MRGNEINPWQVGSALAVVGMGIFLIWEGRRYPLGTLNAMGPGFFPVWIGVVLAGLGGFLLVTNSRAREEGTPMKLRPLLSIFASVVFFLWSAERFGLVIAAFGLVVISAIADPPFRPLRAVGLGLLVAAFGHLVFVYGLNVPLHTFPR